MMLMNLYLHRPACELIFLTHAEHARIHNKVRHIPCSESKKKKIAEAHLGKPLPEEHKRSIAKGRTGYVMPQAVKDKLSKANGEHLAKFGKSCKGKSWKIVAGKRVWYEL